MICWLIFGQKFSKICEKRYEVVGKVLLVTEFFAYEPYEDQITLIAKKKHWLPIFDRPNLTKNQTHLF